MRLHGQRRLGVLIGVNQATGELVIGVGGQSVVDEEFGLGIKRFSVSLDQSMDLGARCF